MNIEKEKKRKPGRPKICKKPVSIDRAVEIIRAAVEKRYANDPALIEKKSYKKGTLYNFIWKAKLTNFGDRHCVILDEDEVLHLVS